MGIIQTTVNTVFKYIDDPREDWLIIESHLGEGWIATEALAIALFCVARHLHDFNACIKAAVNHSGDSDSTGAIAGNILGAILGYNNIPENFITNLQNKNYIEGIANRFTSIKDKNVIPQDLRNLK